MKDGAADPRGPEWVRSGEHGENLAPLAGVVPTVRVDECADDGPQRAAVELERIANRYRDSLPSKDSAAAEELILAADLLYVELWRDCGREGRRQKLKGADLLRRWVEKTTAPVLPATTEDQKRARAYMVQDVIESGVADRGEAVRIAVAVAAARGLDLGQNKSFSDAHDELQAGGDWLASGIADAGIYWPVTDADLRALGRDEPLPGERERRDQLLADAAAAMPGYWKISDCIRLLKKKAEYFAPYADEPDPAIREILGVKGWQIPLFDAVATGAKLPSDNGLREIVKNARAN